MMVHQEYLSICFYCYHNQMYVNQPIAAAPPVRGSNHPSYAHTSHGEGCDSMSVREGGCSERTQPFQTPEQSDSRCVVLL